MAIENRSSYDKEYKLIKDNLLVLCLDSMEQSKGVLNYHAIVKSLLKITIVYIIYLVIIRFLGLNIIDILLVTSLISIVLVFWFYVDGLGTPNSTHVNLARHYAIYKGYELGKAFEYLKETDNLYDFEEESYKKFKELECLNKEKRTN